MKKIDLFECAFSAFMLGVAAIFFAGAVVGGLVVFDGLALPYREAAGVVVVNYAGRQTPGNVYVRTPDGVGAMNINNSDRSWDAPNQPVSVIYHVGRLSGQVRPVSIKERGQ